MDDSNNLFLEWLANLGPAFLIGLAIGYFLKKSFKIFLFVFGAMAVIGLILQSQGISVFSLDTLTPVAESGKGFFLWIGELAKENLGKMTAQGASGIAGFALGLKLG